MTEEKDLRTPEEKDLGQSGKEEDSGKEQENEEAGTKQEAEASGGEAGKEPQETEAGKKGIFSKKKSDKEKALQEKVDALEDRVKRQMAEFDNYRKRTDREKDQMFSMGEKSVIEKILPVVDNFERGFDTVAEEDKDDAFVTGMKKVYEQLTKQLSDLGVTPIDAVGKEFDPNLHNAVMQVEDDSKESGTVAQELQKGYMFHDTVLRHSMVSVVS